MTVKTASEQDGPRNIKNKLGHAIHNAVPSHSCFRHHRINELDHSRASAPAHVCGTDRRNRKLPRRHLFSGAPTHEGPVGIVNWTWLDGRTASTCDRRRPAGYPEPASWLLLCTALRARNAHLREGG